MNVRLRSNNLNRSEKAIKLFLGMLIICFLTYSGVFAQSSPNIIVILTDDQGYADVGFNGSTEIPTPNIDRIANEGVRFSRGYVTHAVCGPSRAGLITGRYQNRFGFGRNPIFAPNDSMQGLPLSEETLADVLGNVGYTSSIIGKWHLGAHPSLHPLERGFDEFFGFLAGGHRYFPEELTLRDVSEARQQWDGYRTQIMKNRGRVPIQEYLTDELSKEAVDFVNRNAGEDPFFLYLAYNAPHTPLQATEKYLKRFAHIEDEKRRTYAAMISAVDDGVGWVFDALEEHDILHNTMIFFLSDNGGPTHDNASDNSPLRGAKGMFYEGGVRVPFAMMWPERIPAGVDYDHPISSLDIFATAISQAGADSRNKLDGVDLVPFLTGQIESKPHEALYWRNHDRDWTAAVQGDYKLLNLTDDQEELYNLKNDIGETNLLAQNAVSEYDLISEKMNKWLSSLKKPQFLGLLQNNEYDRLHPDRFEIVNPYEPDKTMPEVPQGYSLIWSEEFQNDGNLNEEYWNFEKGFLRNNELQWYQEDNVTISNGVALFEARREQLKNKYYDPESSNWRENREYANYTSASINTRDKFSFQYGIIEVRARIDTTRGSWPAIWTLGDERNWPDRGEIDIMEFYRIQDEPTILANAAWAQEARWQPVWDSAKIPLEDLLEDMPDWPERFHIWTMEWDEDYISLYLNDTLLNRISVEKATYDDGFNPFRQPHFILLNLAIGSNGGNPEASNFPLTYEVDYVRIFQKSTIDD